MIFFYNSLTDRLSKDETINHMSQCFETFKVGDVTSKDPDSILATHFGKDRDLTIYLTKNEWMQIGKEGEVIDAVLADIKIQRSADEGKEVIFSETFMLDQDHTLPDILEDLWEKDYWLEEEMEEGRE